MPMLLSFYLEIHKRLNALNKLLSSLMLYGLDFLLNTAGLPPATVQCCKLLSLLCLTEIQKESQ